MKWGIFPNTALKFAKRLSSPLNKSDFDHESSFDLFISPRIESFRNY